ncbi:MAG TPA: lysophospholipid acyltransferase family protein [Candidatus Paceibacterota bacterium]|nr:lysophospholipid acyltransferase family protein [Candidatus Paceibacterota bacterium]
MSQSHTILYRAMRGVLRLALGFYFRRIERFHVERVPESGAVIFVSNHPNSLTDSWIIGATVSRKVNFVATVQLFRFRPVKWFLTHCGVIPINRVKDDPKAMRSVTDTFEACFRVLEHGEAIGIFPEGVTYDDSRLREVKSGAARMALELEHRHGGKLGLKLVPVGLTYSAKELYRSDVLANFGEPIIAAEFIEGYAERRKECINRLTAEIERRLQSQIAHIPELEHARVVEGVKRLYLDRLVLGLRTNGEAISPRAEELILTQKITEAVAHVFNNEPQRAAAFAAKLNFYERWLQKLRLNDESLALFPNREKLVGQSLFWSAVALLGAPVALYGWIHRALPHLVIKWAVNKFPAAEKRKAQTSTTKIIGGVVVYTSFFAIYVAIFQAFFGWHASFWYALPLPIATLLAFYHLRELRRLRAGLRNVIVLMRAPLATKRLLALRAELIAEIEAVQHERRNAREQAVSL